MGLKRREEMEEEEKKLRTGQMEVVNNTAITFKQRMIFNVCSCILGPSL